MGWLDSCTERTGAGGKDFGAGPLRHRTFEAEVLQTSVPFKEGEWGDDYPQWRTRWQLKPNSSKLSLPYMKTKALLILAVGGGSVKMQLSLVFNASPKLQRVGVYTKHSGANYPHHFVQQEVLFAECDLFRWMGPNRGAAGVLVQCLFIACQIHCGSLSQGLGQKGWFCRLITCMTRNQYYSMQIIHDPWDHPIKIKHKRHFWYLESPINKC